MYRQLCGQLQAGVLLLEVTFSRLTGPCGAVSTVSINRRSNMAQAVQKLVAKVPTLLGGEFTVL